MTYPEVEVVLPDFSRQNLTPQLQMAYDVWHRLVAVTSPNGNLEEVDNINLVGALNLLRNGSAELENGTTNEVPMGWGEVGYTTTGPTVNRVRSSSDKVDAATASRSTSNPLMTWAPRRIGFSADPGVVREGAI